jgi:uncharacterized membrane protein (DUF4010 family)
MAAGVRTMPIIGLLGHVLTMIAAGNPVLPAVGLAVVGGFFMIEYIDKVRQQRVGFTTECTGLIAYSVGILVASGRPQVAAALTVATVLLLTGKQPLRQFAGALPRQEIVTFVTFMLLAVVILPVLPNQDFTRFRLNPFQAWLVVVAVSGISYASYILQRLTRSDESLLLTGLLGGLYSSTATTVALARRSSGEPNPRAYAGGIILATGTMYLRILLLVATFSTDLGRQLMPPLLGLAVVGIVAGTALIRMQRVRRRVRAETQPAEEIQHPLEIRAAVLFAALYLGLGIVTKLTTEHLGESGLLALAAVVGLTDIVPFILGVARELGSSVQPAAAVTAIMVSIASNNVVKGIYALALGDRTTGWWSLAGLTVLAVLTIAVGLI